MTLDLDERDRTFRFGSSEFEDLLSELSNLTAQPQSEDEWPENQFKLLAQADVLKWVIPTDYGGLAITPEELIVGYQLLSQACLLTTFVLTQRNGACQRIATSKNDVIKADLLPSLARGEMFATVGISHLTTSRQHLKTPAVKATAIDGGYSLKGTVPWVTGATQADYIVTGGTCEDGGQILAVIPTSAEGVSVKQPVRMLALTASETGPVALDNVEISEQYVLAGPTAQVMKQGKGGGAGSLATSALALGTAASALEHLAYEAERRPELKEILEPLTNEHKKISTDLHATARGNDAALNPGLNAESIRQRANSLVLRSTQAFLAASKGAGFVESHPAGRAVREAMFFLVWSCPQPVLSAALREFACLIDD